MKLDICGPDKSAPERPQVTEIERRPDLDPLFFRVLEMYASKVDDRKDLIDHAIRTRRLVQEFAGKLIPPEALSAVLLHDLVDRFHHHESAKCTNGRRQAAGPALLEVCTSPDMSKAQGEYVMAILADCIATEKASGQHRRDMARRMDISDNVKAMISDHYEGRVSVEAWRQTEPFIDTMFMSEFLKDTNIEAVIIKACELLDNMENPSSPRQSSWLQDVLEAESFYAPLCEVLGLDGLAAALRSRANIIRLHGQGEQQTVDRAQQCYDRLCTLGAGNLVRRIFDHEAKGNVLTQPVVGKEDESYRSRPVHIGEFVIDDEGVIMQGIYRLKTVGSDAVKELASREKGEAAYAAMDLLGLTIISKDIPSQAWDFVRFLCQHIDAHPDIFKLKAAMSKQQPIYVHGPWDYVEAVRQEMAAQGFDTERCQFVVQPDEEIARRGKGYQVSKVTFLLQTENANEFVPTEVQFVTKDERRRARIGGVAHIIYKYIKQLEKQRPVSDDERRQIAKSLSQTLCDMHKRKSHVDPGSLLVNERSMPKLKLVMDDIAAWLQHEAEYR